MASLLAVRWLAACMSEANPVTGEHELTAMGQPAEIATGAKAHQEVVKDHGLIVDPALQG